MCIKNYKIILYGCKEDHKINNIFLDGFYNTQLINESEIKCSNCDKNKNNSYQKKFYKCIECDQNLCILCNEKHNKKHNIIDYDKNNYICAIHNDYLYSYCKECKMNLCMSCHQKEKNHEIIEYKSILPNRDIIYEELSELRKKIDKLNSIINDIVLRLQKVQEKMEIFYKINYDIFNNYEIQNKNYYILKNVNGILDNLKMNNIDDIVTNGNQLGKNAMDILNIYDKMFNKENNHDIKIEKNNNEKSEKINSNEKQRGTVKRKDSTINPNLLKQSNLQTKETHNKKENEKEKEKEKILKLNKGKNINENQYKKRHTIKDKFKDKDSICIDDKIDDNEQLDKNEIILLYKINKGDKNLKIFGEKFASRNKGKSSITYEDETKEISEYINITKNMKNKETLKIKLKINDIKDMSYMFYDCKTLLELSKNSTLDTSQVTDMSFLFYNCNSLSSLSCISKWNTANVKSMNNLFHGCVSIKKLPDLSGWNTSNVTEMERMFNECFYLEYLPDISNWNTSKVCKMNEMFNNCESLISLPDISKWDTSNVYNFNSMFSSCKKLKRIPDISLWDDSKAQFKYNMFRNCTSLISEIPLKFK
jgi:surface protein